MPTISPNFSVEQALRGGWRSPSGRWTFPSQTVAAAPHSGLVGELLPTGVWAPGSPGEPVIGGTLPPEEVIEALKGGGLGRAELGAGSGVPPKASRALLRAEFDALPEETKKSIIVRMIAAQRSLSEGRLGPSGKKGERYFKALAALSEGDTEALEEGLRFVKVDKETALREAQEGLYFEGAPKIREGSAWSKDELDEWTNVENVRATTLKERLRGQVQETIGRQTGEGTMKLRGALKELNPLFTWARREEMKFGDKMTMLHEALSQPLSHGITRHELKTLAPDMDKALQHSIDLNVKNYGVSGVMKGGKSLADLATKAQQAYQQGNVAAAVAYSKAIARANDGYFDTMRKEIYNAEQYLGKGRVTAYRVKNLPQGSMGPPSRSITMVKALVPIERARKEDIIEDLGEVPGTRTRHPIYGDTYEDRYLEDLREHRGVQSEKFGPHKAATQEQLAKALQKEDNLRFSTYVKQGGTHRPANVAWMKGLAGQARKELPLLFPKGQPVKGKDLAGLDPLARQAIKLMKGEARSLPLVEFQKSMGPKRVQSLGWESVLKNLPHNLKSKETAFLLGGLQHNLDDLPMAKLVELVGSKKRANILLKVLKLLT